ncbi:HEXXH motif-containing putative peptide modification protein [Castellaniella sp.]|uniref:aKG-HExxH-type peptide beta-hydroxylase n=1 Tax=Castellaniella sp. TaxID=1955812 RepID=UPI00355DD5C2
MSAHRIEFGFMPDGARAQQMDRYAHTLLADSLAHIQSRAGPVLGPDALTPLISQLRAGAQFGPACFGRYYELALALMDDDLEEASQAADALQQAQPAGPDPDSGSCPGPRLVALGDLPAGDAALYLRLMDTDPQTSFAMRSPTAQAAADFRQRFGQALGLMQAAVPALAAEFSGLVRELCMVTGDPEASYQFDGGSSYMLWGGLFLNIDSHETDVALVEVLAHEATHCLLFGFSQDETLVLNLDDELYQSPLRVDPRPMDGIYHATYVSARMHWAMSRLVEHPGLTAEQRAQATEARALDAEHFWSGHRVVMQHARLTATGEAVMAQAQAYMAAQ